MMVEKVSLQDIAIMFVASTMLRFEKGICIFIVLHTYKVSLSLFVLVPPLGGKNDALV